MLAQLRRGSRRTDRAAFDADRRIDDAKASGPRMLDRDDHVARHDLRVFGHPIDGVYRSGRNAMALEQRHPVVGRLGDGDLDQNVFQLIAVARAVLVGPKPRVLGQLGTLERCAEPLPLLIVPDRKAHEAILCGDDLHGSGDRVTTPLALRHLGQLKGKLVYDLVYNPEETTLLRHARAQGAETIGGLEMLVSQACRQFEWWTGQHAPRAVMEQAAGHFLRIQNSEFRILGSL